MRPLVNDVTRSGLTVNGSTPERRELHFDLPTWYARLAGSTPRTASVLAQAITTPSILAAAPHALTTAPAAA
jgi:hypothetical protein